MAKFFGGLVTGVLLVVVTLALLVLAAVRLGETATVVPARSLLVLDLDGEIVERPPTTLPLPFLEARAPLTVTDLWRSLRAAETDARIKAVLVAPSGVGAGWAKLQEVRDSIARLNKSGKPAIAFLRSPGTREYYLGAAAGRVFMPPEDMLDMKGLRAELTFFRGTLDKIGVQVDIEHAGKYKDFGDTFTRTSMSPETREVLNGVLDEIYGRLVASVAEARKRAPAEVRAAIDEGPFLARQALDKGLVDGLLYEDQTVAEIEKAAGAGRLTRIGIREYLRAKPANPAKGGRARVAMVVAEGTITGNLVTGLDGDTGIAAPSFIKLLKQVGNDAGIRGVIVRVDSPGGESFASDEIWREMNLLSKKKPMVVSMSDEAASGGYYIAMTGDTVVAYPDTYTGSIGVVYGKANLRGLYQKLGISKETLTRGRFAAIDSDYVPLDEAGRRKLREGVDDNYRVFVGKVAEARKRKFEEVEPLAQGRVWLGSQAHRHGLVDELGGLDRVMELIRSKAGIPRNQDIDLVVYPPKRTLLDLLMSRSLEGQPPEWIDAFLRRWPVSALSRGSYLRLMPFTLSVR